MTPEQALAHLAPPLPLAVGYSGGADSTALLHLAARLWPGQVRALHVHHGLQAAADGFARHCVATCAALGVPLSVLRIDARHAPGESPEAAAREGRYRALAGAARDAGVGCVLLAQHADDQVETLLLALTRGAGLPGLAAMPAAFEREGVRFIRPWLEVPGEQVRAWVAGQGLAFVEDPTNADEQRTRNRIRRRLLPVLAQAFPAYRQTFARSARHAAAAQRVIDDVAAADLAAMNGVPRIEALQALGRERQAGVLRHWLRAEHAAAASTAQLDALLDQVAACTTRGHRIELRVAGGWVCRAGAGLTWHAGPSHPPMPAEAPDDTG